MGSGRMYTHRVVVVECAYCERFAVFPEFGNVREADSEARRRGWTASARSPWRCPDHRKLENPFCRHGHDKRIVGTVGASENCRECNRIQTRRYREKGEG